MAKKTKDKIKKNFKQLKEFKVEIVPIHELKPNEYNPNRQSEAEFELLLKSMREDGFLWMN